MIDRSEPELVLTDEELASGIRSVAEVLAEMNAKADDPTTIELDGGDIVLHPAPNCDYRIPAEEINTPELCIVWMLHIGRKKWGTFSVLEAIADMASEAHGFSIPWEAIGRG